MLSSPCDSSLLSGWVAVSFSTSLSYPISYPSLSLSVSVVWGPSAVAPAPVLMRCLETSTGIPSCEVRVWEGSYYSVQITPVRNEPPTTTPNSNLVGERAQQGVKEKPPVVFEVWGLSFPLANVITVSPRGTLER